MNASSSIGPLELTFLDAFSLTWNWDQDVAVFCHEGAEFWRGSFLPAFLVGGAAEFRKSRARSVAAGEDGRFRVELSGEAFHGDLLLHVRPDGLALRELQITWEKPTALHSMVFGASPLTEQQIQESGRVDETWFPDWKAWGYCVPGARVAPLGSYFRCFDLGNATIPLGSFGPAMGAPYAAAFPRPVLSAAMGNDGAWACLGAGEVPDAALSLQIFASNGCFEWRYREDLWGGPEGLTRTWAAPLEITFATEAYQAYHRYFDRFPVRLRLGRRVPNFDFWGTWGEFKEQTFDLDAFLENAKQTARPEVLEIDDGWETFISSGIPHYKRFPDFDAQIQRMKEAGFSIGFWLSLGWVDEPEAAGLSEGDLIPTRTGDPARVNWQLDPRTTWKRHFCPDPSSPAARQFIAERTKNLIHKFGPTMLKYDFTYGIPGPDHAAPRDPAFRGERLAWHLFRIGSEAAAEADPSLRVYGYMIHPLFHEWVDFVWLDDLGDAGPHEAAGHAHWTVWASLLGPRGLALGGSSGYYWDADSDILLNSIILGAPGACSRLDTGWQRRAMNLRQAVHRWFRRPTLWEPLWLNSNSGGIHLDLCLRSWGRVETGAGDRRLTALVLREGPVTDPEFPLLENLEWTGRWALISQDEHGLDKSQSVACIPFDTGSFLRLPPGPWTKLRRIYRDRADEVTALEPGQSCLIEFDASAASEDSALGFLLEG